MRRTGVGDVVNSAGVPGAGVFVHVRICATSVHVYECLCVVVCVFLECTIMLAFPSCVMPLFNVFVRIACLGSSCRFLAEAGRCEGQSEGGRLRERESKRGSLFYFILQACC